MPSPLEAIAWDAPGGHVHRATGPDGHVLYEMDWEGDRLRSLRVALPDRRQLELVTGRGEHPIIGPCDALRLDPRGEPLAFCGRIDWRAPREIPPLDRPPALPPGGGSALLNVIAWQAQREGVRSLRYRGPYPTVALFASLQASFHVPGDPAAAEEEFTRDVEAAAIAGRMSQPPVDFIPAPHVWTWPSARTCVQHRDGIERLYLDGHAFERAPIGPRRLIEDDAGDLVARVLVGDRVLADLCRLSPEGELRGEPRALPAAPSDLCGQPLPAGVVEVLAEAIAAGAAHLLQPAVRDVMRPGMVTWGDPGLALVRADERGVIVHAGLVALLPEEPTALFAVLLELLGWPIRKLAQRHLSEAAEALLRR